MIDGWTREYVVEVRHAELIAGSPFSHPFREEIVRCRDCYYYEPDGEPSAVYPDSHWCDRMMHYLEPDGFCKWGRRDA